MPDVLDYFLLPLIGILLVTAQAMWGTAIKNHHLIKGSLVTIAYNLVTNPMIWLGGFLYVVAAMIYFFLLSRSKFFIVQVSMTAVALLFSTLLSVVLFHEKVRLINFIGVILIFAGMFLVLNR